MSETPTGVRARFAQVNLVVADMERTMAFYRLLGVEVNDMPPPWGAHHRTLTGAGEDATVEFDSVVSVANWAPEWHAVRTGAVVGFAVASADEVDSVVETIAEHGHRVLQPPHDAFFGARYAVVEDPDGIAVGIMGPIDENRRWIPDLPT